MKKDFLVIGGGIIGLATGLQLLQRYPGSQVLLLEKEAAIAQHQTGHNSGVVHAGVYYPPGSMKAEFCRRGLQATLDLCRSNGIPCKQPGKLIVATDNLELSRLQSLFQRSRDNAVNCEQLSSEALQDLEPEISGVGAMLVQDTAIVDYQLVCKELARQFIDLGGQIEYHARVDEITENDIEVSVRTARARYQSAFLVSCAGLQADRVARLHGLDIDFQIIPFRGEYYRLSERWNDRIGHLIYPVPDPELPFLGIHLTRMIDGCITVGPNAVLGWKREAYGRINFSMKDGLDFLASMGFWRLAARHYRHGLREWLKSISRHAYLRQVRKYCPGIRSDDLLPWPAGVRAQAVLADGTMVHDFLFAESGRSLHVCNAPSPAATSALPIAEHICNHIAGRGYDA